MSRCIMNELKECTHCGQCDVCDLDPNKICDNCCKCIEESQQEDEDYAVVPVHLQRPDEAESPAADGWGEETALLDEDDNDPLESESSDDDPKEDDYVAEPLDIDPKLMLEWEEKLRESFAETTGERDKLPKLHAQRIKKHKD